MDAVTALTLALLGVAVGVLSALLGVGGGFLMVPVLDEMLRQRGMPGEVSQRVAVATSLLAMTPTAFAAGWRQRRVGNVLARAVLWLSPGAVLGAVAGVWFGRALSADTLRLIFAGALFLIGLRMLTEKKGQEPDRSPEINPAVFGGLGLFTGVFSALTGLGGGVLTVPAMKFMGFRLHQAVGTSSATIGFMALAGSLTYAAQPVAPAGRAGVWLTGCAAPLWALCMAAVAFFATRWGVAWSNGMPAHRLKRVFGGFLLALVGRVFWVVARG